MFDTKRYIDRPHQKPKRFYPASEIDNSANRFSIEATAAVDPSDGGAYWIDFRVFEVISQDVSSDEWGYQVNSAMGGETTPDVEKAEVFLSGNIKWDECSNWSFQGADHFCTREQMTSLGELFDRLYDIAADMMPEKALFKKRSPP